MTALAIVIMSLSAAGLIALRVWVFRNDDDGREEEDVPEKTYDLDKLIALIAAGREMRAWQKKYYSRDATPAAKQEALIRSKRAEHDFDRMLDDVDPPPSQPSLFVDPPEARPGAYSS